MPRVLMDSAARSAEHPTSTPYGHAPLHVGSSLNRMNEPKSTTDNGLRGSPVQRAIGRRAKLFRIRGLQARVLGELTVVGISL